ncbi:MAG: DUF4189 domain-containing protein [Hyphomicrobium sp.]|nr:DUF4189 domain-containing protein [Hyphomicrobium sp.]
MIFTRVALAVLLASTFVAPVAAEDTKWGALALDTAKAEQAPAYGIGGGDTEEEAVANAVNFCNEAEGAACKSVVTYEQCGALAVSGKGDAGWGKSATKLTAETQALAGCDNDACKVVVSDCNSEE